MARQRPAAEGSERQGVQMSGGAIAALSGLALLVVFMVQNTEEIEVRLPVLEPQLAGLASHSRYCFARRIGLVRPGRVPPSSASRRATSRVTVSAAISGSARHLLRRSRDVLRHHHAVAGPTVDCRRRRRLLVIAAVPDRGRPQSVVEVLPSRRGNSSTAIPYRTRLPNARLRHPGYPPAVTIYEDILLLRRAARRRTTRAIVRAVWRGSRRTDGLRQDVGGEGLGIDDPARRCDLVVDPTAAPRLQGPGRRSVWRPATGPRAGAPSRRL